MARSPFSIPRSRASEGYLNLISGGEYGVADLIHDGDVKLSEAAGFGGQGATVEHELDGGGRASRMQLGITYHLFVALAFGR